MNRFCILIASVILSSALAFAHEGNEHVRGVVTQVSPQSITVETTNKKTTTLKLTAKTTYQLGGKRAQLTDLKVGDRVVVDVPEKSSEALLIQIGTQDVNAQASQTAGKAAPAKKLDITFQSSPKPTKTGDNMFEVIVKDAAGKPIADADVSVMFDMPAMPAMKMPAMHNEMKLKSAGGGKYTGSGQVTMSGQWTVTVGVSQNGKEIGRKELKVTAQ